MALPNALKPEPNFYKEELERIQNQFSSRKLLIDAGDNEELKKEYVILESIIGIVQN